MSKVELKREAYLRQFGLCWQCKNPLPWSEEDVLLDRIDGALADTHRIKPGAENGRYTTENTRAVHPGCQQVIHDTLRVRVLSIEELKQTFEGYKKWQHDRIARSNALDAALKRGMDKLPPGMEAEMRADLQLAEQREGPWRKRLQADVLRVDDPIVDAVMCQRGVGPITAAVMMAAVDWEIADTVSSLWAYVGYNGPSENRHVRGVMGGGNRLLRSHVYLVATGFLKADNQDYRRFYDARKARMKASQGLVMHRTRADQQKKLTPWAEVSDAHRHADALRYMVKLWLSHLWQVARELRGLPHAPAYVLADPQHRPIPPTDCGWPSIEALRQAHAERMAKA